MWRKVVFVVAILLPPPLKVLVYRSLGWRIGKGVRIGLSYIDSREVSLGDRARIGHFNVIKGVKRLVVGEETYIANFNDIFGSGSGPGYPGELRIGDGVNFMSHHFVDVAGTVIIGNRAVIAGRDTHFWSHQVGLVDGVSRLMPLRICVGDDAYIGARAMLLGCSIPAGAVVGAGSVVTKDFAPEKDRLLIAGNPAAIKKRYEQGETT